MNKFKIGDIVEVIELVGPDKYYWKIELGTKGIIKKIDSIRCWISIDDKSNNDKSDKLIPMFKNQLKKI